MRGISELIAGMKACKTKDDATTFVTMCVAEIAAARDGTKMHKHTPQEHAEADIGYCIGYIADREERSRLHGLFAVSHPVFGSSY